MELIERDIYGPDVTLGIESMGSYAISVANRWLLGWPRLVKQHLKAQTYLEALRIQSDLEEDVLAEATDMKHLARHEILQVHAISPAPPVIG